MADTLMDVVARRPAPALTPYVERYIGYRFEGFPPGSHQGLPSRHMTVVISLDAPVRVNADSGSGRSLGSFAALAGGLHTAPVTIVHDGTQHGISIDVHPLGARALFGLPAGAVGGLVVGLSDLIGGRATELVERLGLAQGWDARFAVLDEVLTSVVVEAAAVAGGVARAWQQLVAAGGAVGIGALAAEVGWSRRHLAERFRAELGLTPKVAARVLRFEHAVSLLRGAEPPSLAEIALACGYYDQAHLNREWRELAGCTPLQWLREELPIVQDVDLVPA